MAIRSIMASIDKAAIGITIAVVAIALGFVAVSDMAQSNPPPASVPKAPRSNRASSGRTKRSICRHSGQG